MPHAVWERTRQVNLDGTFYVTQGRAYYGIPLSSILSILYSAVAKQMEQQTPQGGSIIGISSISALVGGGLQWYVIFWQHNRSRLSFLASHYTPTKAGILSLMQSCAVALGKYNIRANAILPGTIATDINKEDLQDDAKKEGMVKRTCLGRLGGTSN